MAKEKEDVDFTFDTTGFTNGVKSIAKGISDVTRNTVRMAKSVSKGVINAAAQIGLLKLAFRGVRSAIGQMPEIGKTFSIAKDIIMKNFLFPVRKAIFPLLQKFLDWVRDNRAMFVKWGQTLVTIFEVVSSAIGRVIEIGKGLLRTFGGFFNRVFGTQIKGLNDLLNILSFKFAVAVEFLSRLLEPIVKTIEPVVKILVDNFSKILSPIADIAGHIIDIATGLLDMNTNGNSLVTIFSDIAGFIGDAAGWALEMVESFVKGFKPYISPVVDSVAKIAEAFKSIWNSIFSSDEKIKGWKAIFKFIGDVVGGTVKATFEVIENIVKTIDSTIKSIDDLSKVLTGKDPGKEFGKNIGDALLGIYDFFNPAQAVLRKAQNVDDAIVKPSGEIIRTDPADYLIATKTPGALGGFGKTINIDFTGMTIVVQKATQEEARTMATSFVNMFRDEINRELVESGSV